MSRRGLLRVAGAVVVMLAVAVTAGVFMRRDPSPAVRATVSVAAALATERSAEYARAMAPRAFEFPRDHGAHPGYRTEWWYVTGNVRDADGRPFGFQVTFFRIALTSAAPARTSSWGTADVYMAHLALSDVATGRFHAVERFSRAAQGLAGAEAVPLRVWLEDWALEGRPSGDAEQPVMALRAAAGAIGLDLTLRSVKPVVLQGDRGLSQKGPEAGNASYYYSLTRLQTAGTVVVDGRAFSVEGTSWMDREWGTSALGPDQVGWDWFALQLDDGREVMLYRLRRRDGSVDPFSSGTLIAVDGATTRLRAGDVALEVLATWRSPRDGRTYPARWRVGVPAEGIDVTVTPRMADQELTLGVRYWEGAVTVRGMAAGRAVSGTGYVELTGYGDGPR